MLYNSSTLGQMLCNEVIDGTVSIIRNYVIIVQMKTANTVWAVDLWSTDGPNHMKLI